jgi:hypothetical protein
MAADRKCEYGGAVSMSRLIPRHVAAQVGAALSDTRVVLITGARQAGKSTLVKVVAGDRLAERRDLDRAQDRAAAITDPVGFVDSVDLLVTDEIQRVPELLLAIRPPSTRILARAGTCSPAHPSCSG